MQVAFPVGFPEACHTEAIPNERTTEMGRQKARKPRRERPVRQQAAIDDLTSVNPLQGAIASQGGAGCCFICGDDPARWYRWSGSREEALLCDDCKGIQENMYSSGPLDRLVPMG